MEQILMYLAIAFIVGLIIVLGITFHRLNKLKLQLETSYSSNSELWGKYLLIYDKYEKSTSILSEYEKTNVLQINKINELEEEVENYATKLVDYEIKNIKIQSNIDDQTDFISYLNERLQKSEAERDKLQHSVKVLQETHANVLDECERLYSENSKLQSKLSRKGLGKKGRKKENVIIEQPIDDSQITEVEFEEYIDISEVKTLTDYIGYEFIAISHRGENVKGLICEDLTYSECIIVFDKVKEFIGWPTNSEKTIPEKYKNNNYRGLYTSHDHVLNYFKSFKIIKK